MRVRRVIVGSLVGVGAAAAVTAVMVATSPSDSVRTAIASFRRPQQVPVNEADRATAANLIGERLDEGRFSLVAEGDETAGTTVHK